MKKLLLSFKLLALLACLSSALGASAYSFESDGIYYTIVSATYKTVQVTYKDTNYATYSGTLTIPSTVTYNGSTYTVTKIGNRAFYGSNLSELVLPPTITDIGNEAFHYLYGDTRITCLAFDPPFVGYHFFEYDSDNYSTCVFYVPYHAREAYKSDDWWGTVLIDESPTYDFNVNGIYYNIVSNTEVEVTNQNIDNNIDNGNSYSGNVGIPRIVVYKGSYFEVAYIGFSAFINCPNLTNVTMPSTIKQIGWTAFANCPSLINATIPASVTYIEVEAFSRNNLRSVTSLPTTPPDLSGDYPFWNCGASQLFVPRESVSAYQENGSWFFNDVKPTLDYAANYYSNGTIEFNSTGLYPWTDVVEGGRTYVRSGNMAVPSSTSTMTATVTVPGNSLTTLSFDFKVLGEGSNYDVCIFSVDGSQQFSYGALQDSWESYSVELSPGTHTLTWTYRKDSSVNPTGDYFAIDNVRLIVNEPYACYTSSNQTLTFYYDDMRANRSGTTYDLNAATSLPAWLDVASQIKKVVFNASFAEARPTSTAAWFFNMTNLETITDLKYLNTSDVEIMEGMFGNCSKLTSLNLSNFNTAGVTKMGTMFYNCLGLRTLDLSSFDTHNVTDTRVMFSSSANLTTIYVGSKWSTDAVTASSNMFYGCTSLVGGMGTTFDANHVDKAYAHVDGGTSNPGYLNSTAEAYACYTSSDRTLTFYYDTQRTSRTGTTYDLNEGDNAPDWVYAVPTQIKYVVFNPSFASARPTSTKTWFYGLSNLESITDLMFLNTSQVKNMFGMFGNCSKLTSLCLGNFNTDNVTDMGQMFYACSGLTSLDLGSFDTYRVTNMSEMFANCENLATIYVSDNWTTRVVTQSNNMFGGCLSLEGSQGTTYNSSHVTAAYAHVDGGTSYPGYLSRVPDNMLWSKEGLIVYAGQIVNLPVYMSTSGASRTILFFAHFGSYCTLVGVEKGELLTDDAAILFNGANGGVIINANGRCIIEHAGEGVLCYLKLKVADDAAFIEEQSMINNISMDALSTNQTLYLDSWMSWMMVSGVYGDVNSDGIRNVADVSALINLLLTGGYTPDTADVNGDGNVNTADVSALISFLLQ